MHQLVIRIADGVDRLLLRFVLVVTVGWFAAGRFVLDVRLVGVMSLRCAAVFAPFVASLLPVLAPMFLRLVWVVRVFIRIVLCFIRL